MKKTKAAVMAVLLFFAAGAVFGQNNSALYGTWTGGAMDDELEFTAPNKWELGGMVEGTFSYNGATLTITDRGRNSTAPVTISGNTLTIGSFTGDTSMNEVLSGRYQKAAAGGKVINFLAIGAHSASNVGGGRTTHIELNLSGTGIDDLTRDDITITPQGAVTGRLVLQDSGGGTFGLYFDGVSKTQTVTVTIRKEGYTINPPSRQVEIVAQ
jgi:hypothetical protein